MRNLLYALPFFAVIAFAQAPDSRLTQGADNPPKDPQALSRARADGSAGGTAQSPLSDEAKKGVGAGAGPHLSGRRAAPRTDDRESESARPKDAPVQQK
jgi:hypothetical protein